MQQAPVEFRVLSRTRHRLRVRLLAGPRDRRQALESIASFLRQRSDVEDFRVNPTTGSITLFYQGEVDPPNFAALLAEAGVQAEERASASSGPQFAPASDTATGVVSSVTKLDMLMSRAFRRRLDLKSGLPLALLALGAWKVATQGIGWKQIPASTLIWYAYSMFKDLAIPDAPDSNGRGND